MNSTAHHRHSAIAAEQTINQGFVDLIWDGNNGPAKEPESEPCKNADKGCVWMSNPKVSVNQSAFHKCIYDVLECPEKGCPSKFERRYQQRHEVFCRYKKQNCLACGRLTVMIEEQKHLEQECSTFHIYRKTISNGSWEHAFKSKKSLLQAFKMSAAQLSFLNARQMEIKLTEAEERFEEESEKARALCQKVIQELTEEENPHNPALWSDEKLIKTVKQRRIKINISGILTSKKAKNAVDRIRSSIQKEEERKLAALLNTYSTRVEHVRNDWKQKVEMDTKKLNTRRNVAEKRYEIHAQNYTQDNDSKDEAEKKAKLKSTNYQKAASRGRRRKSPSREAKGSGSRSSSRGRSRTSGEGGLEEASGRPRSKERTPSSGRTLSPARRSGDRVRK